MEWRKRMTQTEMLRYRVPEITSDEEANVLLETAKSAIMARRYPFEDFPEELEKR